MPPFSPASNAGEVAAFLCSSHSRRDPDIEIVTGEYPAVTPQLRERYGALPPDAFTLAVACTKPTGRGTIRLTDGDWRSPPAIDGPYLKTDHDLAVTLEAIEMARKTTEMGPDPEDELLGARVRAPGLREGDEEVAVGGGVRLAAHPLAHGYHPDAIDFMPVIQLRTPAKRKPDASLVNVELYSCREKAFNHKSQKNFNK